MLRYFITAIHFVKNHDGYGEEEFWSCGLKIKNMHTSQKESYRNVRTKNIKVFRTKNGFTWCDSLCVNNEYTLNVMC